MDISILEQAPTSAVQSGAEAVQFAIELAKKGEEYGYKRIWVAEHHNTLDYASPSPEMIAAAMASATQTIRVGTGGIMLMHYSPYKIAENIKILSALSNGRADFGAGRAPGGDHAATYALAMAKAPDFSNQYEKLNNSLKMIAGEEEKTSNRRLQEVYTTPDDIILPEAWLLGASGSSAQQAGEFGIGYSFAQFFSEDSMDEKIFDSYREHFKPSPYFDQPRVMVAYLVTVAETEEEAIRRARPIDLQLLSRSKDKEHQLLSTDEANRIELTAEEEEKIQGRRSRHLVGTAKQVADYLRAEVEKYGIDELMICSNQAEPAYRLDSYRLLAEEILS